MCVRHLNYKKRYDQAHGKTNQINCLPCKAQISLYNNSKCLICTQSGVTDLCIPFLCFITFDCFYVMMDRICWDVTMQASRFLSFNNSINLSVKYIKATVCSKSVILWFICCCSHWVSEFGGVVLLFLLSFLCYQSFYCGKD